MNFKDLGCNASVTELTQEYGKSSFVCSNKSCRRTFPKPLKTLNLRVSSDLYDACPYCLSVLNPTKKEPRTDKGPELNTGISSVLCHNLGFLAERVGKGLVPDECLVCREILSCMTAASPTK